MIGFATSPNFREVGHILFQLSEPLVYQPAKGETLVVPQGFVTNWASIPRPVWPILSPFEFINEATLHDYLYWLRGGHPYGLTRLQADNLLFQTCRAKKIPLWQCTSIWSGVRAIGWAGWMKKPKPLPTIENGTV